MQEAKLPSTRLGEALKQFAESAKTAEEALRQLTEALCQALLLEGEVSSLKLQKGDCTNANDDTTSSATE